MAAAPSSRAHLALVIHFHQPVGNLDSVVQSATDRCYRPFLELLADYPEIPMTLHYSGCLLEWMEANASDVTRLLRSLVERGQVELMTGGFYEPILAALPHRDRVGQVKMLTTHLRREYLAEPRGAWLTERVWEQEVVGALTEAKVRYTVVDDTMFNAVGITDTELTGPFVTEHEGVPMLVYAGDRNLRYLIPYKRVDRVFDYIRNASTAGEPRLFVYGDDGEKFGEWPDTFERVYEGKWLANFFEELMNQRDWLYLTTLGEHSATAIPKGRVYLPSSSYHEMMTWALPTQARLTVGKARRELEKDDPQGVLPFLLGAPWRAFLAKYPEVNHLQKRMLRVSADINSVDEPPDGAIRELYRAQCNCAYWHGAFGGFYLGFMRGALWHHLMRAEGMVAGLRSAPSVTTIDLNADTLDEILIRAPWGAAILSPHQGGALIELDDWSVGANVLAVVGRHREAYHLEDENPSDPDAETDADEMQASQPRSDVDRDSLVFDEYARGALVDIVDGHRVTDAYEYSVDEGGLARLWTSVDGLRIEKKVSADAEELVAAYEITNDSGSRYEGTFATEASVMPLNLGRELTEIKVEETGSGWRVTQDEAEVVLEVDLGVTARIEHEPIDTASTSLEGLKQMTQGVAVTALWDLALDAGETFSVETRWRLVANTAALTKMERGVSAAL